MTNLCDFCENTASITYTVMSISGSLATIAELCEPCDAR